MTYDIIMVQMWMDQFRKLPPENVNELPVEARIAWALIKRGR
jgi:hypothetical protein